MSEAKVLRGQLRQIVKEVMPELMASEALKEIEQRLLKVVFQRLELIDERVKQMQAYAIRQSAPVEPKKD